MRKRGIDRLAAAAIGAAIAAGACHRTGPPPAPPTVPVTAYTVEARDATLPHEFVGRVAAAREIALLPRVTGYLERQVFSDGSRVRAGELLFVVDPRPFRAALEQARAELAQAQAALAKAEHDVARYEPLVRDRAVPRQMLDDALSARRSGAASVKAQEAAVESARLSLLYTDVRSPVDGRVGRALVFPGALVNAGQTVLATVSTIDPADVFFTVSEVRYLHIAPLVGDPEHPSARVELLLADGSAYPQPGQIDFIDRAIAPQTGTLKFRARFPNSDERLRPGMFSRVRVLEPLHGVLLVPTRGVVQVLSNTSVVVVGPGEVAEARPVVLGPEIGVYRMVRSGLSAGDRVVVDGVAQARPGAKLAVTPIDDAHLTGAAPPAPGGAPPPARNAGTATGSGSGGGGEGQQGGESRAGD